MSEYKQHYKNPRLGFGDTDQNRILRAYKQDKSRRDVRSQAFNKNRELQNVSPTSPQCAAEDVSTITDERMKKLIKWKEERNRKKKLEAAKKKPAFKVGIVHHSLCSPRIKNDIPTTVPKIPTQAKHQNDIQKRITKATQKRLLAKAAAKQAAVASKNAASTSTKYPMNKKKTPNKEQKSFAPIAYEFKPPAGVQKMPLFGLVPMEQTPQEKGDFFIQDESTKSKTLDSNKQKDMSLEKSNTSVPYTHDIEKVKTSSPMLSLNKRKSSLNLNESIHNLDDATSELNTTITLSPKEQTMQDSLQKDQSSSDNIDMKTPPQKTTSTNASFEKKNCMEDLIVFSPYLTLSRGKKNVRKEQLQRLGIGRLSGEIPTKDTIMQNLNISVEEEERTAQYFKFLLTKEIDRLQELCRKWLDIRLENDVPDDAVYEINQAVGQTNLLINKKFERFRSLVQDCETGRGEMLVTCRDLQGFWDMTYMEVKDCDSRFEKLEQRRDRGWQEEECTVAKPAIKKRISTKKQIVTSKPSSLRSLILAARKKKMEAGTLNKEDLLLDTNINKKHMTPLNNRKSVTEANSDTRRSTRRSKSVDLNERKSTPAENPKTSLMRKKQFSDTKRIKSPFAAIKISRMCKTPEVRLDDTISYVNSDQTPGKSILKKSEELINKEARIKSAHKVNFDDQTILTEVSLDEETQTKLSLAAALKRIDSFDLEELSPQECINVEKRLTFETEDSDTADDLNELTSEIQTKFKDKRTKSKLIIENVVDFNPLNNTTCIEKESSPDIEKLRKSLKHRIRHKDSLNVEAIDVNILTATPLNTTYVGTPVVSKELSNIGDVQQDYDLGIRVLRNRTITTNDTPKINNTSKTMTPKRNSKKENKSPVKSSRKNSLKLSQKDENKYVTPNKGMMEMENIFTENVDKKRRSSRKSVAFSADCLVCAENKPVLPMTPHSKRRSKTPSRQSRNHAFDKDLISWDTPERKHPPSRVTRSHTNN